MSWITPPTNPPSHHLPTHPPTHPREWWEVDVGGEEKLLHEYWSPGISLTLIHCRTQQREKVEKHLSYLATVLYSVSFTGVTELSCDNVGPIFPWHFRINWAFVAWCTLEPCARLAQIRSTYLMWWCRLAQQAACPRQQILSNFCPQHSL